MLTQYSHHPKTILTQYNSTLIYLPIHPPPLAAVVSVGKSAQGLPKLPHNRHLHTTGRHIVAVVCRQYPAQNPPAHPRREQWRANPIAQTPTFATVE